MFLPLEACRVNTVKKFYLQAVYMFMATREFIHFLKARI